MKNLSRIEHLWREGKQHFEMGERFQGKNIAETILAINPQFVPARVALAFFFYEEGDYDSALVHASFANQLESEFPHLRKLLADVCFLTGMYEEARKYYSVLVKRGKPEKLVKERLSICLNQASDNKRPKLKTIRSITKTRSGTSSTGA